MNFIEVSNNNLSTSECRKIFDRLQKEPIQAFCLRDSVISDKNYNNLMKTVAVSNSLRHLSLSVQLLQDTFRVQLLAKTLQKNMSLSGLFIHGNRIRDHGMKLLQSSLLNHPGIVSLDVSDCNLGDSGLETLFGLLQPTDSRPGLRELVIGDNPDITPNGWANFGIALASGNNLNTLSLDFNDMGDSSVNCVLVGLASRRCIQHLDLECVSATDVTGQCLLHLVKNYKMRLKSLNLDGNMITPALLEEIRLHIPGLLDQLLGVMSDDDQSLAMSEPPLDSPSEALEGLDNQDVTGLDSNSNTECQLNIIGTINSLDTTPAPTARDNSITDELVDVEDDEDLATNENDPVNNDANEIHVFDENHIANDTIAKTANLAADINKTPSAGDIRWATKSTGSMKYEQLASGSDASICSYGSMKSHSVNDNLIYQRPGSGSIQIEVKAHTETAGINDDNKSNGGQIIIHETPSVVSLHRYANGLTGVDDAGFLMDGTVDMFDRPKSAPVNGIQANGVSVLGEKTDGVQALSSNSALLQHFGHITPPIPNEFHLLHARRRLSGGSVVNRNGTDKETKTSFVSNVKGTDLNKTKTAFGRHGRHN